jgi:hypothetical protein
MLQRQTLTKHRTILVSAPGLEASKLPCMIEAGLFGEISRMAESGTFGLFRSLPAANAAQDLWGIATGVTLQKDSAARSATEAPAGLVYSRRPPLWEVSAQQDIESCSIAWPGATESYSNHLLVVTDKIHIPFGSSHRNWPLLPGSVNCREYQAPILGLRVHPSEVPECDLDYMLNGLSDPVLKNVLRNAVAAAATVQAITLDVIAKKRHSVIALHFDILDRVRCLQGVVRQDATTLTLRAHQFFDLLIGNLRSMLSRNAVLIIVSPPTRGAAGDVSPGAVIIWGAGVEPNILLDDPHLEDIAPTALHIVDCALPQFWSGRPLVQAGRAVRVLKPLEKDECRINGLNC